MHEKRQWAAATEESVAKVDITAITISSWQFRKLEFLERVLDTALLCNFSQIDFWQCKVWHAWFEWVQPSSQKVERCCGALRKKRESGSEKRDFKADIEFLSIEFVEF